MNTEALMFAAARALEEHRDPFERSFLVEHDVPLDQAMLLADEAALGLRVLVAVRNALLHGGPEALVIANLIVDVAVRQVREG